MPDPARTVTIFQKQPNPILVPKGQTIFTEGELGEVMYGVIEGEVELVVNGKVVERIGKGDIFGEGALVHESRVRGSTAIATTDCTLASLDQQRFLFAIQTTPMFAVEVMRSYSERLRHLKHQI